MRIYIFDYSIFLCFSGNQYAKDDLWIIGDQFIKATFQSFDAIDAQAIKKEQPRPYCYDYYNIRFFYKSFVSSGNPSALGRICNSLADAINGSSFLPRLILMVPDVDVLRTMTYFKFGASLVIGKVNGKFVNKIVDEINDRKAKLKKIKAGTVISGEPKLLWMGIIDKPQPDKVLSLRRKHNEILEETLSLHKNCYYITPDRAVNRSDFDRNNNMTSAGKENYWKFIDAMVKKFDREPELFIPKKVVSEMNAKAMERNKPEPP